MARHFGVGVETTYGTPVTATRWFEALNESVEDDRQFESIETIRSVSPQQMVELNQKAAGDTELAANYDGIGLLLLHLVGSADSVTGSVNTHTFPASTGIPAADRIGLSLTLEYQRDDALVWKYPGSKITSFGHTFGTDQSSRMTVAFLGNTATTATTWSATPSYSTLLPMTPAMASIAFDGGSNLKARNVTITVENPVDEPFTLGSTTFAAEPQRSGVLRVTGSAEVLFDDLTEYAKFDGSTDVSVVVVSTNTTESITYTFAKCRLTQATPHMTGRDRLTATYEWESYFNSTATENMQIVLANNDAAP